MCFLARCVLSVVTQTPRPVFAGLRVALMARMSMRPAGIAQLANVSNMRPIPYGPKRYRYRAPLKTTRKRFKLYTIGVERWRRQSHLRRDVGAYGQWKTTETRRLCAKIAKEHVISVPWAQRKSIRNYAAILLAHRPSKGFSWKQIALQMPTRTPRQLATHWYAVLQRNRRHADKSIRFNRPVVHESNSMPSKRPTTTTTLKSSASPYYWRVVEDRALTLIVNSILAKKKDGPANMNSSDWKIVSRRMRPHARSPSECLKQWRRLSRDNSDF
jgi:hypothetical protein